MIPIPPLARRAVCGLFLGLAAWTSGAAAAGLDCRSPADTFQRNVCADPGLSALAAEVASAYDRMTGLPWRRGLRERQDAALARLRGGPQDRATIRQGLEARIVALREENAWFSTHGFEEAEERRIRTTCLPLISSEGAAAQRRGCRVAEFGGLGTVDGRRLAFALYEYPPDPTGELAHETALVILSGGRPGEWTVEIAERIAEASCRRPVLAPHGEAVLLHLPCDETGTASGPIPLLYSRDGPPSFRIWREVEAESWRGTLDPRLPAGTEVRGAVWLDAERLAAPFSLFRAADPDCCPTAGRAEARLALDGDRLVLRDVTLLPPPRPMPQR